MARPIIGIGMIGCGTVGCGVARLLQDQADLYARRTGVDLRLSRVLVRDLAKPRDTGSINPDLLTDDPDIFFSSDPMQIVVEVAGGSGVIGEYFERALRSGRHVVTANKSLLSTRGPQLFRIARENDVSIAFEASCAGGVPIITGMRFGLMANEIDAVYGIFNGTCNFILTKMTCDGETYENALRQAQEKGFAEADPTLDVSGRDAAQKLGIVASLAFGVNATERHVWSEGIDQLDLTDIRFGAELGYDIKLLGIAEHFPTRTDGNISLRVHPCFLRNDLPLTQVRDSFNAVSVYGHAVGHCFFYGHGAGQLPTASAVVSDVLNIASEWYPQAFRQIPLWRDDAPNAVPINPDDLISRFYIRINVKDAPGVLAKVARILGDVGISISSVLQHEPDPDQTVPVVITTHLSRQGSLREALEQITAEDVVEGTPVWIRIVDLPED